MENAEKQIESLEQQITKLESMAESVQELDDLCARNKTRANKDLDRAQKMAKELRDTDEIASNMSMTLRSLQEHTTFMKDFDVDREILQMAIKDFVKGLALGKQRDVLEVCQPMMKLLA
jgi:chromosome segregation ATPase